jgi:hypothetical protein
MAQIVQITLQAGTTSPGPYNVYYNALMQSNLVATFTLTQILLGPTILVPDNANTIIVQNVNAACGGYQSSTI